MKPCDPVHNLGGNTLPVQGMDLPLILEERSEYRARFITDMAELTSLWKEKKIQPEHLRNDAPFPRVGLTEAQCQQYHRQLFYWQLTPRLIQCLVQRAGKIANSLGDKATSPLREELRQCRENRQSLLRYHRRLLN